MQERSYISYFNIEFNGCVSIRRTIESLDESGDLISSRYWRIVLEPGEHKLEDYIDDSELLQQAQSIWTEQFIQEYQANKQALIEQNRPK